MQEMKFPRRRMIRSVLKSVARIAFDTFARLEIIGKENLPPKGPLLIVGNHFSFADPAAMIRLAPSSIEFFAGANPAFAPTWAGYLPKLWSVFYVYRGTGSRKALRSAESVLSQGGMLGIFPEGGAWAQVLRPPRPGAAYIATRTGAPILPVGLYGINDIFPLRFRNKVKVTINIGKPFGPFETSGRGRERRAQLDEIGHSIMKKIAEMLPPDMRGRYSDDPAIRAAAQDAERYPWADAIEDEVNK
ncbi:MAG: lysophospholipid acyltransferase family protein [Chloroflexota bacterium]|nr:lysophospholipid acyltransferase family protein [Chloroflexota bacterium]